MSSNRVSRLRYSAEKDRGWVLECPFDGQGMAMLTPFGTGQLNGAPRLTGTLAERIRRPPGDLDTISGTEGIEDRRRYLIGCTRPHWFTVPGRWLLDRATEFEDARWSTITVLKRFNRVDPDLLNLASEARRGPSRTGSVL